MSGLSNNAELISDSIKRLTSSLEQLRTSRSVDEATLSMLTTELEGDSESIESILLCSVHMQRTAHDILSCGSSSRLAIVCMALTRAQSFVL